MTIQAIPLLQKTSCIIGFDLLLDSYACELRRYKSQ
jgi:hypothetical protein